MPKRERGVPEGLTIATGTVELIPAESVEDRMTGLIKERIAQGRHLWVALVSYEVDPRRGIVNLDRNSMLSTPVVGCYLCETGWRPTADKLPCKPIGFDEDGEEEVGHADD